MSINIPQSELEVLEKSFQLNTQSVLKIKKQTPLNLFFEQ
jgi:hypothetical protein